MVQDALDEGVGIRIAGHDGRAVFPARQGRIPLIEAQVAFALRRIRSMTGKAVVGQDGLGLAPEVCRLGGRAEGGGRCETEQCREFFYRVGGASLILFTTARRSN